jgi:hypothetical protein
MAGSVARRRCTASCTSGATSTACVVTSRGREKVRIRRTRSAARTLACSIVANRFWTGCSAASVSLASVTLSRIAVKMLLKS